MGHNPFELVERAVSQPWADDIPTKVDDTRHVYVSGLRSGMTLDISVAKELGHALLKVASGSTPGVLGVSYRESGAD